MEKKIFNNNNIFSTNFITLKLSDYADKLKNSTFSTATTTTNLFIF